MRSFLIALAVAGCSAAAPIEEQMSSTSHLASVDAFVPGLDAQIDITPANGARFSGGAQSDAITFSGFTQAPGQTVRVQIQDASGTWTTLATTQTSSTATTFNDPAPIFRWSVDAAISGEQWPAGALVRYRAIGLDASGNDFALPFFDDAANACVAKLPANPSWKVVLERCQSPFSPTLGSKLVDSKRAAALVSTDADPALSFFTPPYLSRKGEAFAFQVDAYYLAVDAPPSLSEYQLRFGFLDNGDDASAAYYNLGDLGIGREMHCHVFDNDAGSGTACYVRNFGVDPFGNPDFSGDAHAALADLLLGENSFATVAMVKFGNQFGPVAGNDVQFFVFNGNGDLVDQAQLDSVGSNEAIPNNCVNCHGGNYDPLTLNLVGSAFLPFDPQAFLFATDDGFTYSDQAEEFRKLNVIVKNSGAPPGITQLIDGWYGGNAEKPGTSANLDWIPKGWNDSAESKTVYRELYKPYCRTCHVSQVGDFAFQRYEDFLGESTKIADDLCNKTEMPIAEATLRRFWESPARAYAVNALNLTSACGGTQ